MPRKNNTGVAGALRLAQTQPVTFSEGLIRTDDNSVLGYVSDLYNTEIDRNGNIRRRKGSVVMNSGKLNEKWYFKESYQIAGVTVLFGLSYKRELWAWIGAWPETDFKVCEKNIYSRFPHYNSGSNRPDYNPWVSFSRGSSFHVLKTDRHMTIVNNLNDAVRIYNRGCFAIAKYNEDVTKTFMKDDIDASRNETDIDLAVYVSVKDVTNRIMEPAVVVKSDDRYPLVEGTVQFAAMNEENVPGKFTDPKKIETGSPYFSIFDSSYFGKEGLEISPKGFLSADDADLSLTYGVYKDDYGNNYKKIGTSWTPEYPVAGTAENLDVTFVLQGIYNETTQEVEKKVWMIFKSDPSSYLKIDDSAYVWFNVSKVFSWFPDDSDGSFARYRNLDNRVLCLKNNSKPSYAIDRNTISSFTHNVESNEWEFIWDSDKNKATWYEVDIDQSDELFSLQLGLITFTFNDGSETIDRNIIFPYDGGAVFHGTIKIYPSGTDYRLTEVCRTYDSFVLNSDVCVFEHMGYNLWDIIQFVAAESIDPDVDVSGVLTIDDFGDGEKLIVDNADGQVWDFLQNGYRWCVKNGENIVARSQIGILGANSVVYELSALTSLPENFNALPSQLKPAYLPVISLHGSSILRYPDPDKNTDVFYDVQYAFNVDDVLIVIQDGAIWTGNTNTLKLTYDKAIQGAVLSADRFYSGVLIGTTDGIYFYNNGKLEHCVDGQKITAITIASGTNGAVVVDDNGRLYYAYIMLMESGFYAKVNDIHRDVSDIDFSNAIVKYVNGVFYFAMEDQIIGLCIERSEEGTIRRFDRIYNFEGQKIDGITEYEGQPVVWFGTGAVKSEVFEQPYDGGIG